MKNRKQANTTNYYYETIEKYTKEGDELPYTLEHITSEKLYREFIEDTSDDYILKLMKLHSNKGGGSKHNDTGTTTGNILSNK